MKEKMQITDTEETNGTVNVTDKQKSNSNELVEKIEIENTPFTIMRVDERWFVAMGKYRLTPPLKNKDEALAAAADESWWRIMQVVQIMIEENELKNKGQLNGEITGRVETRKLK